MLPREGAVPADVLAGIDDMIRRLEGVPGGIARPEEWPLVQKDYLQVLTVLEKSLNSWFEDDDVATGLFGQGYTLIRGMTNATPRRAPLIEDEVERQVRALKQLRVGVERLRALRSRAGITAVLDTNVLMHYQRPDTVAWAEVIGGGPVRLILVACVIDELDNKKYTGSDRMSRRAGLAVRALIGAPTVQARAGIGMIRRQCARIVRAGRLRGGYAVNPGPVGSERTRWSSGGGSGI